MDTRRKISSFRGVNRGGAGLGGGVIRLIRDAETGAFPQAPPSPATPDRPRAGDRRCATLSGPPEAAQPRLPVRPHRLARSRTLPFQGRNTGSNPVGATSVSPRQLD